MAQTDGNNAKGKKYLGLMSPAVLETENRGLSNEAAGLYLSKKKDSTIAFLANMSEEELRSIMKA